MKGENTVSINSSKPWNISSDVIPSWLLLDKIDDTQLKVTFKEDNNTLFDRSAPVKFVVQGSEDTFEFPFRIVQPAPVKIAANARISSDQGTGHARVEFTKGEIFRTNYLVKKGRFTIEFDDMKMSAICNLGFVFLGTTTDANFKFHVESANTYWFRCAGAFTWIAPLKKPYTFDEVNAIRRLDFEIKDAGEGLIDISIYI